MKAKFAIAAAVAVLGAVGAACGSNTADEATSAASEATSAASSAASEATSAASEATSAASSAASTDPILIGISAAKTGIISPFDVEPAEAFQMAVDEINQAGGIAGRQVNVEWIDTKSDPALAKTNAEELLGKGAVAILATCDFDFGSPAAQAANDAGVIGISLCASDPKFSDTETIGPLAFSMGTGTDVKGSLAAEWAFQQKGWKTAYLMQDELLEYTKSLGKYFAKRFTDLGGTVSGEDKFTGNESLDPAPNVTRLRDKGANVDVIILPSVVPAASTMIKAIRDAGIETPIFMPGAAVDGTLVTSVIPDISEFYSTPMACMPAYCEGDPSPKVKEFSDKFAAKFGNPPTLSYPLEGYDLAYVLKQAIETAGSTDGKALQTALESQVYDGIAGEVAFQPGCHKPNKRPHRIVQYTGGKGKFIAEVSVQEIAPVGDLNNCRDKAG